MHGPAAHGQTRAMRTSTATQRHAPRGASGRQAEATRRDRAPDGLTWAGRRRRVRLSPLRRADAKRLTAAVAKSLPQPAAGPAAPSRAHGRDVAPEPRERRVGRGAERPRSGSAGRGWPCGMGPKGCSSRLPVEDVELDAVDAGVVGAGVDG